MLQTNKIIPAVVAAVCLIQGAITGPVPKPQNYYYAADTNDYDGFGDDFPNPMDAMDFSNDPTQATYIDYSNADSTSMQYNDYDDYSGFQTVETFNYAIVASGPSSSDIHAYKNGESVSINQLPDRFQNLNPFQMDSFFNDDPFQNFDPFKLVPFFNDDSSEADAFGNDIFPELFEYFAEENPGFLPIAENRKGWERADLGDDILRLLGTTKTARDTQRHMKEF